MLYLIPIIFFILVHLATASLFSPTWDFPHHLLAGYIRLGETIPPTNYQFPPYGVFTDVLPLVFSRLFPPSWFPTSYLLFSVIAGCLGVAFFYRLVKEAFGVKIALLSTIALFLLPRFVGHLHTNIKDIVTSSFFITTAYYFYRYLINKKLKDAILVVTFHIFAVNTKITVLQLYPVFITWAFFHELYIEKQAKVSQKSIGAYFLLFSAQLIIPIIAWFALWPNNPKSFFSSLDLVVNILPLISTSSVFYPVEQLVFTTPLLITIFVPFGLFVLLEKVRHKENSLAFFFCFLFFYTLLKYPLFGLPVIDDIRYFIEIYYPLTVSFILGVEFLAKKFSLPVFYGIFAALIYTLIHFHPYQINFYSILATNKDPDFWAASYREVFAYLNKHLPKDKIVSVRLAPELASYYIRPDLRKNLNILPPEKSEVVVILNRPSLFPLFQVDHFFATHTPQKIIFDNNGTPLTYIYFQ